MSVLVICGIMVGYICSAVTDFAVTVAEDANIAVSYTHLDVYKRQSMTSIR